MNPRGKFRLDSQQKGYSIPFIKKYRRYAAALKQKKRLGVAGNLRHTRSNFRPLFRNPIKPSRRRNVSQLGTARPIRASRAWFLKKQRSLRQEPSQKLAKALHRKLKGRIFRQSPYSVRGARLRRAETYSHMLAHSIAKLPKTYKNFGQTLPRFERRPGLRQTVTRPSLSRLRQLADFSTWFTAHPPLEYRRVGRGVLRPPLQPLLARPQLSGPRGASLRGATNFNMPSLTTRPIPAAKMLAAHLRARSKRTKTKFRNSRPLSEYAFGQKIDAESFSGRKRVRDVRKLYETHTKEALKNAQRWNFRETRVINRFLFFFYGGLHAGSFRKLRRAFTSHKLLQLKNLI